MNYKEANKLMKNYDDLKRSLDEELILTVDCHQITNIVCNRLKKKLKFLIEHDSKSKYIKSFEDVLKYFEG